MSVEADEDFAGYMEDLAQRKAEEELVLDMYARHEEWRQTTWSGWMVRQILAIANHVMPFFQTLAEVMSTSSKNQTLSEILLKLVVRVIAIAVCVAAVFVGAQVIQLLLGGREIIIEQEVIIEVDESDDEDENEGNQANKNNNNRRNKENKKTK